MGAESGWEWVWLGVGLAGVRVPRGPESGWEEVWLGGEVWLGVTSSRGCVAKGTCLPGRVILVDSEISLES